jgi:predicted RNA-binding protein
MRALCLEDAVFITDYKEGIVLQDTMDSVGKGGNGFVALVKLLVLRRMR